MFYGFEIENFKGISKRVRIDFNRLTLLFGPNSAGKSTILHALTYLRELLDHGEADVHETALGGSVLDLGGFDRMVNNHDRDRPIKLRMQWYAYNFENIHGRPLAGGPLEAIEGGEGEVWMELTIRYRRTPGYVGPIIDEVTFGVGEDRDQPLLWIEVGPSLLKGEPLRAHVNLDASFLGLSWRARERWKSVAFPEGPVLAEGDRAQSPDFWVGPSKPAFAISRERLSALPPLDSPVSIIPIGTGATETQGSTLSELQAFFEVTLLGSLKWLARELRALTYVGPIRSVPSWHMLDSRRRPRGASWADGVAAWERLLEDDGDLVEKTNSWLARLGVTCQVEIQHLHTNDASAEALTDGHVDQTLKRLLLRQGSTLVLPSEVGTGISQVIPVVVALLDRWEMVAIEQPELHIHPALQVELGDLLLEWVAADTNIAIIETHSEHLILRILRRLREYHAGELPDDVPPFWRVSEQFSVIYVEAGDDGTSVRRLKIDETGEFEEPWPGGFFEERVKELF